MTSPAVRGQSILRHKPPARRSRAIASASAGDRVPSGSSVIAPPPLRPGPRRDRALWRASSCPARARRPVPSGAPRSAATSLTLKPTTSCNTRARCSSTDRRCSAPIMSRWPIPGGGDVARSPRRGDACPWPGASGQWRDCPARAVPARPGPRSARCVATPARTAKEGLLHQVLRLLDVAGQEERLSHQRAFHADEEALVVAFHAGISRTSSAAPGCTLINTSGTRPRAAVDQTRPGRLLTCPEQPKDWHGSREQQLKHVGNDSREHVATTRA